jgi:CheY-like chemotaxis protein
MMNGSIRVESEEGVGSTFSFTVKLPVNSSATKDKLPIPGFLKDKNVFIMDSSQHNRSKISNILGAFGAECVESEEFIMWDESRYQHVFLDNKVLLKCSDAETEQIRQSCQSDSGPLVIAMLDVVSLHQQIKRINDLELDGYIIKPVKQSELLHVFSSKYKLPEADASGKEELESEPEVSPEEEKRILLVEDNEDNRLLVKTYLKNLPYIIDEAENGKIAVDMYRNNTYNLIIMDVQMPVMDGHEATRIMRVLEVEKGLPSTPIIALTAHAIKEEIDKCMAAGCDTHVGKPIKKATLISIIADFVT